MAVEMQQIQYGDHPAQRLLWLPAAPTMTGHGRASVPLLALVHGGGWVGGAPDGASYLELMRFGLARGWATASIGYRLAPGVRFPAPSDDVATALHWLTQHAGDLGWSGRRPWLLGSSAGANLAALVALQAAQRERPAVGGVITVALPADFRPRMDPDPFAQKADDPALLAYLGHSPYDDPVRAAAASPQALVHQQAPPFMVVHSRRDPRVDARCSLGFVRALRRHGVPVWTRVFTERGHSLALALPTLCGHVGEFLTTFDERFGTFDGQRNRLQWPTPTA